MSDRFQTISSSKKNVKTMLITWACLSAAALLGLLVSLAVCIFIEVIMLFVFLFMIVLVAKARWLLEFEGKILTITNLANQQQYYFDDLTAKDFIITQTPSQKEKNCAHLKILGSSAVFNDVQNISELNAYITSHFE